MLMISIREVRIQCDQGASCLVAMRVKGALVSAGALFIATSISSARQQAHRLGWTRGGGRDLCPACSRHRQ